MKELQIRRELDKLDQQVVQKAEVVVDNTRGITKELEDKQIRNVIAVADDTQSIAVVDNFIKYQIGRSYDPKNPDKKWCLRDKMGRRFGEAVCKDFEWLQGLSREKARGEVTAEDLAIRLVRRYLGYLARHFKYAQVQQGGG